jgi:hypothetical protein
MKKINLVKVLFIGPCENGSTTSMRYQALCDIYGKDKIRLINTAVASLETNRIWRSIGWRFKIGPFITKINSLIESEIPKYPLDLVWIEKGVFIKPRTILLLRSTTNTLLHYTPDPAFLYHKSRFFEKSIIHFDHCVTTKSFELELYKKRGAKNIIFCTQGYDSSVHRPQHTIDEKIYDVCFIGHYEKEREVILQEIVDSGLILALAGIKWNKFVKRNQSKNNLCYFGNHLAGMEYSNVISKSKIGLGLLSQWIPEKHTTRTFEIPACGTTLITEFNSETSVFFNSESVLFFKKEFEILDLIIKTINSNSYENISQKGFKTVTEGNFTHLAIMNEIINKIQQ